MILAWLIFGAMADTPSEASLRWANAAEGALVKTGNAAEQLAAVAQDIAAEGRIGKLTVLRGSADELVRRSNLLVRLTTRGGGGAEP